MSKNGFVKNSTYNVDLHIIQKYDLKRRIGKGAYGIVWKAIDRKSRTPVAVKKIYDAFRNPTDAQRTFREIAYLQEFKNHPNIVKLLNVHRANNNTDIYLVFEYVETDLHKCIKREKILQDIHKRYIIYQLLKALKYIHSGNVIHRDLKPPNILINSQCHCKIADFGLARSVARNQTEDEPVLDVMLTDYIATRWYRAPEVLVASKTYSKSIDMWSVGCILGEMLLGKPLFPGSSTVNQLELIINTLGPVSPNDADSVCSGYGNSLLKHSPSPAKATPLSSRLPSISSDALDLLHQFLTLNPNRRITAAEALKHSYVQMFSEPCGETSLPYSVVPPVRDDVRLSIDYYRNKINDAITKNEERQARKVKSSCGEISTTRNGLDCKGSQKFTTVHYDDSRCKPTCNSRKSNYLHSLENNANSGERPMKHPSTHPPHRTLNIARSCHSKPLTSSGKDLTSLEETQLKSLKMKSLPPPAEPLLPMMGQTSHHANLLKNLSKSYLTSIQEYASVTEITQSILTKKKNHLMEQKLHLPKTRSLSRAKSLSVYRRTAEDSKGITNDSKHDENQRKPPGLIHNSFETSQKKNILSAPVQFSNMPTSKKKLPSSIMYPFINLPSNSFKSVAKVGNYNFLVSKNLV